MSINTNQSRDLPVMPIVAAMSLGVFSYLMYIGLPLIIGAISEQLQFDEQQLAWIATADLTGIFFGSVTASLMVSKVELRQIGVLGILIAIVGSGGAILADTAVSLSLARFVADFGGGICHALGLVCLSRYGNTSRNFSLYMVVIVVVGSIWLFALPSITRHWGADGVFTILLLAYLIPAAMLKYICLESTKATNMSTSRASEVAGSQSAKNRLPTLAAWVVLVSVFMFYAGSTSFWTFAERLGTSIGLSADVMSLAFTICNILTLGGCWLAYRLSAKSGPFIPNLVVLPLTILIFLFSMMELAAWSYMAVIFIFFQSWAMSAIFQLAALSEVDATGRFVALVPAFQGLGMSLGPAIAGFLLSIGLPLSGLAGVNAMFVLFSLLAFCFVYVLIRRHGYRYVIK